LALRLALSSVSRGQGCVHQKASRLVKRKRKNEDQKRDGMRVPFVRCSFHCSVRRTSAVF